MKKLPFALAAVMSVISPTLLAQEYGPLLDVAKQVWPKKQTVGVVCYYQAVKNDVDAIAKALGPDSKINLANNQSDSDIEASVDRMVDGKVDYVVIVASDPIIKPGSKAASRVIRMLASNKIPVISTSPELLSSGLAFCLGKETRWELRGGEKTAFRVNLPDRAKVQAILAARGITI